MGNIKMDCILFFRNNSTGNPTKIHIINEETDKSFCGFDDFLAQIYLSENESFLEIEICKKCLKQYKNKRKNNLEL